MSKLPIIVGSLEPVFPSTVQTVFPMDAEDRHLGVEGYEGSHQYLMIDCLGFVDRETRYAESNQTIQFVEKLESGETIPGIQSEQLLIALIDRHKKLNTKFPSREGALAITKMEEALSWLERRVKERMYRGVMEELKK